MGKKEQTLHEELVVLRDELDRTNEELRYLKDEVSKILQIVSARKTAEQGGAYW